MDAYFTVGEEKRRERPPTIDLCDEEDGAVEAEGVDLEFNSQSMEEIALMLR